MTEKIQIMLNSKTADSYFNGKTTDCNFILPKIELRKRHKAFVSVVHAVIPHSFYNVNDTNNKLDYIMKIDGFFINYSITFPNANYNINTLIITMKNLMQPGFTITYNASTNKIKIIHEEYEWTISGNTTTCEELIGYTGLNDFPNRFTFESGKGINLFTVRTLNISSDNFILNNIHTAIPNVASIITSIPVNTTAGGIMIYNNQMNITSLIHDINNISNLHIRLMDQDGDLLDLNGLHWSIKLLLTIE